MSPFNAARYALLLEGLDISEVLRSELEFSGRLDSEYYRPSCLMAEDKVLKRGSVPLAEISDFLIGPFGSAFSVDNYCDDPTYRYIRGKDVKTMEIMDDDNVYMPKADFDRLAKYALQTGDVLVSVVGTLGNSGLVESHHLPAIFSCKSTALRPKGVDPRYLIAYLNSSYGRSLLVRKERGAVQKGLNLDDLKTLQIFVPGTVLQKRISEVQLLAEACKSDSKRAIEAAESALSKALGLTNWKAPESLSFQRSSVDAFAAGRLDAEYFTPRMWSLMAHLGRDGLSLADVAPPRHEPFRLNNETDSFQYIEIGDVRNDGTLDSSVVLNSYAPSRATQVVRTGDVLTSSVRPIRRLSASVTSTQDGFVCSSGFVVLRPVEVSTPTLVTYLRLPLVCELMDLHTSASLYPAISEKDLLALPIPRITKEIQLVVDKSVNLAHELKMRAEDLRNAAKFAVEIAIEKNEEDATQYLEAFK